MTDGLSFTIIWNIQGENVKSQVWFFSIKEKYLEIIINNQI
jgi:hypothetical protein